MLLIFEYYYQILFKISKDIFSNEKNEDIKLSKEQNEILKIIERGIEDLVEFFLKKIIETNFIIKSYIIILFYYQMNITIKQFILIKNINNNIYQLLIKFLQRYQNFLNEYFNTNLEELKKFYKNQRDFFFDFLLNPAFYKKDEQFDLLTNLTTILDLFNEIIKDNINNEEILSENICEKILNYLYIFNEEDKDNTKSPTFKTIKKKYLFLLINYFKSFRSEMNHSSNIIKLILNKLFNHTKDPFIFYNLSLAIFVSKFLPENEGEYINKLEKIFEENYLKPENDNRIRLSLKN